MAAPLATRCPACSTVFRVVPDQLRVSGGWVRCGRCAEVFDATESLVDLETGVPRRWADESEPRPATPPATARAATRVEPEPRPAAPASDEIWADSAPPSTAPTPATPAGHAGPGLAPLAPAEDEPPLEPIEPSEPSEPSEPLLTTPDDSESDGPTAPRAEEPGFLPTPTLPPLEGEPTGLLPADPRADPGDMPLFVRRAERAERWRRPRVRAALGAAALLCVLGLAGQITFAYRDLAAARFPQARPALEQACTLLGCRIEAARAIDALTVESSGLVRIERSGVYRLSVALRNRAGIDVALPALDLSLTDTQGRLIARKVLPASDLGAQTATLGAGRELALQATLQAALPATEPVAGYTIELFYP